MKKSIFLFFAAILCSVSAWAYNLPANYYIYFEKPSSWTQACLLIGKSGYSEGRKMTTISNTNLYYWKTVKWDGYTEYFFMQDEWGGENSSPTHRNQYAGSNKTAVFKTQFKNYHLFTTDGSKLNSTSSYSVINKTQTINVQLKDGSNWVDATVVPADLKASTYALTSATAAGAKSASLAKESTTVSATVSAAYSAKVTLSCTNVLDGYVFEGWYDANGNKITSYTVSDAHTVYARFIQSAEETNEVTVTYMCGTTSVATAVSEFVGVESEKSFTAPTVTGYKFTNWTVGDGMTLIAGTTANDEKITVVTKSASSNYTLVANYEEVLETIYFINTGKWSVVNLHRWGGTATETSWPGEAMTKTGEKIGEYDVYSFTAQQGAFANVIFTNKNTGKDQTDDLTWTAGKYYIYNYGGKSGWYTKEDAEALLVTPVVTHDIVVKAVVPEAWTSTTIGIHYWGEGISGTSTPVATEKDGNWNKYTIKNVPEGVSVNVIFLNGTSWTDDKSKQTANITGITEDKCFQISATKLDSEGKCTVKEVDCDATIEPEVDVYTIMGAGELGLSWDLAKTGNDMTKQADGTYTLVKEGLDLATTGTYEYKVVKNHSWDWSIPSGNTNQTLKVDKDGTYTVTFTLSADKKKLTADTLCTAEKEVILDCSVAGTINLVGGTADFTDKLAMTYDEGTKTYSKTFTALAAGDYQMKVVYGSDWLGYDKLTKPVPANVTEGEDKKIKFSLAEAGDVTVTYHATNGIGLTGNFAAPAPAETKYYIAGTENLTGYNWQVDGLQLTKDGDLYKHTFSALPAGTFEFKVTQGDWEKESWGYNNLGAAYEEVSQGKDGEGNPNGNIKIVTTAVKTITVIFDANKISIEGLTPYVAPLTYTVTVPAGTEKCFIAGAMNGWNFQEMTATANANEFTIEIAGARETDGYKYACQASWDYVEKKEDGNDLDANRTWTANDVVAKWGTAPTYTIVGATAITGANWDLANEANKMTKDGEAYTLTKTGLKLETGDYEYKVAKNGAWGDGQYPAEGNQKVTITENGEYTIVYTYTVGTKLEAAATKTGEYTPDKAVYTVAGDAALCGSEWKADDATNDMTDNSDGTFTWTKTGVTLTGNVGFKVVKNHDFSNGAYPSENWVIDIAGATGVYDITITFKEDDKNITVVTNKTGDLPTETLVYTVTVPAGTEKCYIAGEMNSWAFTLMTQVDATHWTITYNNVTRAAQYKYTCGEGWDYAEKTADGNDVSNRTWAASDIVAKWGAPAAPVAISYVLMGVNGDWTNGIPMTVNPDNADEYVLENQVIIKATDAVKVVTLTDGTATAWCGDVDSWSNATYTADATNGNIVLEDGIYTFYFKKTANNIYINQTGYARNVTNTYGTICLPYASASTTGATFFEVVGQEDGKVYLGSVNTLEAGVPYIFEKSASQIKVVYTGDKETTAGSANGLVGTFADNTTVPNDAYILYGDAFRTNNNSAKPNKINAYRAYLDLSEVEGGKPQPMPGRRYIGMSVQGENEATGLGDIVAPEGQTIKAIVNGQLVIIRGGEMYNVQGQRL